ncbi:dirigent protein 22-like [Lotus japonicus]|uniref:dirigent protein 22-like n=1 Tax=Lotus japonicus TaxID=34305 RepID=UPI0025828508|nr:dirigent protein 22-like [Lotus japonicus]
MDTHHFLTLCFFLLLSCHALTSSATTAEEDASDFVRRLDRKSLGLHKKEKLSHIKLYFHDIVSGPNPTSVTVVPQAHKNDTTFFGMVKMIDDPLTQGPDRSSKLVGKAQGFYAASSQSEFSLLMAMDFVFIEGKYNGSTITILGRNAIFNKVREMPVVGGSGIFRFARGYAEARTKSIDFKTGDAMVEFNVYVFHY